MCGCDKHHDPSAACTCLCSEHQNFQAAFNLAMSRFDEIQALLAEVDRLTADLAQAREALARVEALAELLTEQGDEHVAGCKGQADCARCVQLDLRAALAGPTEEAGDGE